MKVLHLPNNIASQMNTTVKALRDIGVDARGITLVNSSIHDTRYLETFPVPRNKYSPKMLSQWTPFAYAILKAMKWADIIHWHYNTAVLPFNLDLKYAAHLNKGRVVECWGSDLRIPEIASQDNPYINEMYEKYPKFAQGWRERSLRTQKRFAQYGFNYILPDSEISTYLDRSLFPAPFWSSPRILLEEFTPRFPNPEKQIPLIIHAPSRKEFKGTAYIIKVIEQLKRKCSFEFKLIHDVPRSQLLNTLESCDIFVDDLVFGSYGLAAIEAMAMGKPCITYIKPSLINTYPPDLPIRNANQENFDQILEKLLSDGEARARIGQQSRTFVEKYHDAHVVAKQLVKIYENILNTKNQTP